MKKYSVIGVSLAAALLASNVSAESKPEAFPDCGIGAALFENDTGAIISNVIWDLGTTALTSATASPETCEGWNPDAAAFIEKSYDRLVEETAQGQGKHLDTLMSIVQVEEDSRDQVVASVRARMAEIVASAAFSEADKVEKINMYYHTFMGALKS